MRSAMFQGQTRLGAVRPSLNSTLRCRPLQPFRAVRLDVQAEGERLRLNNLRPAEGSRRDKKRKGRGHAAGQGGTCGFGERGQKSRAGPGVRTGFEGGQTPLYRRLPKLRGIAGGMGAGLPKHVVVNLADLEKYFEANEEVTLEKVREKVLSVSGRDRTLPLKVLGTGALSKPLTIKAAACSESAKVKISAAGGSLEILAGPIKWTKKAYKAKVAEMAKAGSDYKVEASKKRAARAKAKGLGSKLRKTKLANPKPKKSFKKL